MATLWILYTQMKIKMMIHMVLLAPLMVSIVNTTSTRNIYCNSDPGDEDISNCTRFWRNSYKSSIYCKNVDIQQGDRLKLETQELERIILNIIFVYVTGHINETTFHMFPNIYSVVVIRSNLTGIVLKSATRQFLLTNSSFPKVTRETLKGVKNLTIVGFMANPGLEFEPGAFKDLNKLETLLIIKQTFPRLKRSFLEGPKHLENLFLNFNNLTEIDEDAFADQPYLENLNLDDNPLEVFKPNISSLLHLQCLSLIGTNLKIFSFDTSSSLRHLNLPTRIFLHNFNHTVLKIKYTNLTSMTVVPMKDLWKPEMMAISEKLKLDGVKLNPLLDPYDYQKFLFYTLIC